MGCGQLVFELRQRVDELGPGDRLEVVARDPGAPTDLPAWCRMTGHALVSADHPVYVIERKAD
jgi:tRNA 2-thiouridine synthesizing protein A